MADHILLGSLHLTNSLLANQFQEFDMNREDLEPEMIEEDDEPVSFQCILLFIA